MWLNRFYSFRWASFWIPWSLHSSFRCWCAD